MGMKFLNKKGWHTGSLRNIENVWKAEQKHDQEQKKLEELRKQIVEERERAEFRQLQEQAGLVPRQERLDFLYDSGLAVGKSSEGFKSLEAYPKPEESAPAQSSSAAQQSSTPGALFEEKPQSANDAWRKLHSDPLLMIRQREQEALARIKNNPVKMAMIRRSVEESKNKENSGDKKKKKKHGKKKASRKKHSSRSRLSDEDDDNSEDSERLSNKKNEGARYDKHYSDGVRGSDSDEEFNERGRQRKEDRKISGKDSHDRDSRRYRDVSRGSDSEEEFREKFGQRKGDRGSRRKDDHDRDPRQYTDVRRDSNEYRARDRHVDSKDRHHQSHDRESRISEAYSRTERKHEKSTHDQYSSHNRSDYNREEKESRCSAVPTSNDIPARGPDNNPQNRRKKAPKLSEEERAARLREMQLDAEVHEEQRWKRIKKADEDDAREAALAAVAKGKNFLEVTKKNVYGAEQGGSATIEESVRRRSHYLQGRSAADAGNAFRR